jgi:hypothetical protein
LVAVSGATHGERGIAERDVHHGEQFVDGHAAASVAVAAAWRRRISFVGANRALRVAGARPRKAALVEVIHRGIGADLRIAGGDGRARADALGLRSPRSAAERMRLCRPAVVRQRAEVRIAADEIAVHAVREAEK